MTTKPRRRAIRTPWGFVANSIVAATVALVGTRMIEQLGVAIWGLFAGRQPYLSNLTTGFREDGTDLVLLGGPILVAIAGVFFLRAMVQSKRRTTQRLLMLWFSLQSFRLLFFEPVSYYLVEDSNMEILLGDRVVPDYLPELSFGLGMLALILLGAAAAPSFLGFCRHYSEIRSQFERLVFISRMAILPGFAAGFLAPVFFVGGGESPFLTLLPLAGVFLVFTAVSALGNKTVYQPETPPELRLSLYLMIGAGAFYVFSQFMAAGVNVPPWDSDMNISFRPPQAVQPVE